MTASLVWAAQSPLGRFSSGDLSAWEDQVFNGKTQYQIAQAADGSGLALHAVADSSASGLVFKQRIDLKKTPWISWRWQLETPLHSGSARQKSGDDFALRLYLVKKSWLAWRSQSLVYVWADEEAIGDSWQSPYAPDNVRMLALDNNSVAAGQWRQHRRNIRADVKQLFGEDWDSVDVIAIMTDSDDSEQKTSAWYGDIRVSAE